LQYPLHWSQQQSNLNKIQLHLHLLMSFQTIQLDNADLVVLLSQQQFDP
jgi:hypothetical protein